MKTLFTAFVPALILLCGCSQPVHEVRYQQKVETYSFTDDKSLTAILSGESATGWIVSASAFDAKSGTLIVFFKKAE